jgi:hypothetical protein
MKKITKEEFNSSFFYIAPGLDFEPLMRFSHMCDTFIYANLYYTFDEVLEGMTSYFSGHPFLKLGDIKKSDVNPLMNFDLHPTHQRHLSDALAVLDKEAQRAYLDAFTPALKEPEWMIEVEVTRKQTGKKVMLKYFTGEGLASYIAFSHNGLYPPKVLATIQTGVLEAPNGLMSKIFNHTQSSPFIWIKGFEPDEYEDVWEKNNALAYKDDVFQCIGSDFSFGWEVPVTYQRNKFNKLEKTIRHCKAFIKETDKKKLEKMPFRNYGKNQLIQNSIADITQNLKEEDNVMILTSALNEKLLQNPVQLSKIKIWEEELDIANNQKCSMKDSLSLLEKLGAENKYTEIYFTPFGLEDEGILLDEFLNKEYAAKMNAVVYRPLDFINLKQQII